MVKKLNLDAVTPRLYLHPRLFNDGTVGRRTYLGYCASPPKSVGYDESRFGDWRGLERRAHRLQHVADCYGRALRRHARLFTARAAALGCEEVWFLDASCQTRVLTVSLASGGAPYFQDVADIVKSAKESPGYRGLSVDGRAAAAAIRYLERWKTFLGRADRYQFAFTEAIEARIRTRVEGERRRLHKRPRRDRPPFMEPTTYIVNNDGRTYVITTDHLGKARWHGTRCCWC